MNLGVRVGSALVLAGALAAALVLGGVVLYTVLGLAVMGGLWELSQLLGRMQAAPPPWVLYPLGGWLLYRYLLPADVPALELGLGAAVALGLLSVLPLRDRAVLRWATAVGGALYLGLSFGYYIALLRWHGADQQRFGLRIVAVVLAGAMAGDICALFAGRLLGRHPFFPRISPRKTVEGAIGGLIASVVVVTVGETWLLGLPLWQSALLGLAVGVTAQGGDLVESAIKRAAGEKDSSRLIPGHGGLLDRLDSLVLLGPVVYCYLRVVALP
ncbi:MAG TPA: phosphatidate cytidylyltransferase [Candidatus Dormibacteraeota bacterium]